MTGLVDLHCHLVPGVDDGAPTLEDALRYLRAYPDRGIVRVAATPHLPARLAGSEYRRRVEDSFEELRGAAAREAPEVELSLAYEVRLDGTGVDPADEGLWLGPGGHVLVEYGMLNLPPEPLEAVAPLLEAGLRPVLVHPERYAGLGSRYAWVERLREAGVRTCLNAGSIWGGYGDAPERLARRMLESGDADLVGSDHHGRPRRSDDLARARDELLERYPGEEEAVETLLSVNPRAALEGEEMRPAPVLSPGRGTAGTEPSRPGAGAGEAPRRSRRRSEG